MMEGGIPAAYPSSLGQGGVCWLDRGNRTTSTSRRFTTVLPISLHDDPHDFLLSRKNRFNHNIGS